MTLDTLLAQVTRRALLRALRLAHGHRGAAAHALGIPERRFHRLLAAAVTREELEALTILRGWPTRPQLAAHARSAR